MKVLRLHGVRDLRLSSEPFPVPFENERVLQVKSVGICGSDVHWFSEGRIGEAQLEHPLVLGHEFAGIAENGERFAVDPAIPCRKCDLCQSGNSNLCEQVIFAGHGNQDGALREWLTWDERNLFPLPDSLTYDDGAMLEPLGVAMHAVNLAHLKPGMSVGIFGCGTIGLLMIQLAKLAGASTIVATDKLSHRLEAARELGAKKAVPVDHGTEVQELMVVTSGHGVDVAFEAAGEQEAVETSFATVYPGGKVILVGIPANDLTSFPASIARRKGLTIKMVRRMRNTYPQAIELVSKGLVDVRSLITHRFPMANATEAFAIAQRREGIKVIIEM